MYKITIHQQMDNYPFYQRQVVSFTIFALRKYNYFDSYTLNG